MEANTSFFHSIQISDPRFEVEGLRQVTVKSAALGGRGDITLALPEDAEDYSDMPVVVLLHGIFGSHWAWTMKGGAHRTLHQQVATGVIPPMILAMPSDGLWGDGSGYVPHQNQNFEKWIVEEVPRAVREADTRVSEDSPLFVAGLSMGGYGALRLAARYSHIFRAASGHSSVTHLDQINERVQQFPQGEAITELEKSLIDLMLDQQANLPPFRFDCGTEDPLIEPNRALHQALWDAGVPHEYHEFPGAHEWPYWEEHLIDTLDFFAHQLQG